MGELLERPLEAPPADARAPRHSPRVPGAEPWARRAGPRPAQGFVPAPDAPEGQSLAPPIERRLTHRAEALWHRLAAGGPLPPAAAVPALLAPPFGACALLFATPGARLRLLHAGSELEALGLADPAAPLGRRLAALSAACLRDGTPAHFQSDQSPALARLQPGILWRGVALPFAPPADADAAARHVVTILSWRRLLSRAETAALHRELHAAMAWMGASFR